MSDIVYLSSCDAESLKNEVAKIRRPTIPVWVPEHSEYDVDTEGSFLRDNVAPEAVGIQYAEYKLYVYVPVMYAFNIIR